MKKILTFIYLLPVLMFPASAQEFEPNVKIIRTVQDCRRFETRRLNADRYLLTKSMDYAPMVYDIKEDELLPFPQRHHIDGMPQDLQITSTGLERQTEISGLKHSGKYISVYGYEPVYFDRENKKAGAILTIKGYKKTSEPVCPCQDEAKFIEKYQRYYCYSCKKYIEEKKYISEYYAQYFVHIDLKENKVDWQTQISYQKKYISSLGVDSSSGLFYYSTQPYFSSGDEKTDGIVKLFALNLSSGKIDKEIEAVLPVRTKGKVPPAYGTHSFISPDYKMAIFWEYDELIDAKTKESFLKEPGPQAVVVDLKSRKTFPLDYIPVAYGHFYDQSAKSFYVQNYQTGEFFRLNEQERKIDLLATFSSGYFTFVQSPQKKFLYGFSKNGIDVYLWPSLEKVKEISYSSVFTGIQTLLSVENMFVSSEGSFAAIGILKAKDRWVSSDFDSGFYLLGFGG